MKTKRNNRMEVAICLFIATLFIFPALSWKDPAVNNLVKTKWRGVILVPTPIDGLFEFRKDSLLLYSNDSIVETMSYETKGDTLFLKKLSGASPCNDEVGKYKCAVKDNTLTLTVLKDDCIARSSCFSPDGYRKE